jgi:hypothetical protein
MQPGEAIARGWAVDAAGGTAVKFHELRDNLSRGGCVALACGRWGPSTRGGGVRRPPREERMKTLQDVQTWRGMKMVDGDGDEDGTIETSSWIVRPASPRGRR